MRKILICALLILGIGFVSPAISSAYNFGDYRSVTLATKAWDALSKGDIEAVLAYTNKCIELYGEKARRMQASMDGYVEGPKEDIFKKWALNDVATCLFIQAEAYRKANMMDEAKETYQKLIDNYSYGQCWDVGGWFWKPAEAAQEKLDAIEAGLDADFSDSTSSGLATKAWEAYAADDLESVLLYTNKCIKLYGAKAKEMQASLTEFPWETNEEIFSYWALNDVGTCLFIQGDAYKNAGMTEEAKISFNQLIDNYYFAQAWDPKGWFWKPAEGAEQRLLEIEEM